MKMLTWVGRIITAIRAAIGTRKIITIKEKTVNTVLTLRRKYFTDNSTVGELFIGFEKLCFTLERSVRILDQNKINAIPVGRYEIVLYYSNHQKIMVPMLLNVPGRTYIEMHPGNKPCDSGGCILVGLQYSTDKPDMILEPRLAFSNLMDNIQHGLQNGKIYLEILENSAKGN